MQNSCFETEAAIAVQFQITDITGENNCCYVSLLIIVNKSVLHELALMDWYSETYVCSHPLISSMIWNPFCISMHMYGLKLKPQHVLEEIEIPKNGIFIPRSCCMQSA